MNDIDKFVKFESVEEEFEEIQFIVTANISFEEACQLLKEKGGYIRHPEMYYEDSDDGDYSPTYELSFCVDNRFHDYFCDDEFVSGPSQGDGCEAELLEYWNDYIGLNEYLSKEWSHGYYPEEYKG